MEFTLVYEGNLPASTQKKKRVDEKHRIRRHFGRQLATLWKHDRRFRDIPLERIPEAIRSKRFRFDLARPIGPPTHFFYRHTVRGVRFVPLVTALRFGRCDLMVRALRYEGDDFSGRLLGGQGDLDNQLKTLLDALRMPHNVNELPSRLPRQRHCLCLLEDDALVQRLTMDTRRILTPRTRNRRDPWVSTTIDVTVTPTAAMFGNTELLFP